MERRRASVLVGLVTTLLCVGATEFTLRRLAERHVVQLPSGERKRVFNPYRPDGLLSYALRPGWSGHHDTAGFRVGVHINALGMRGAEHPREKAPGTRRVLVLGDSFAFGWGVEDDETFPARLEARWRRAGMAIEVFDAAVPGYAADHSWIFLREQGFALAPDLILLASCQNDAGDLGTVRLELGEDRLPRRSESLRRFISEEGRMHYLNEAGRPLPEWLLPASQWLAERSLLYTLLRYDMLRIWLGATERFKSLHRAGEAGPPPDAAVEALPLAEIERGLHTGPAFQLRYHRFLVDAIRREAARRGIPAVTVVTGADAGPLSDDCERDAECLDLARQLARARHPDAYLELDGHWSARGHALAADAIEAWFAAKALLANAR